MNEQDFTNRAEAIRRLFDELVELAPEEREERLVAIDDPYVRRELTSLLNAYPAPENVWSAELEAIHALFAPTGSTSDPEELLGRRIRHYEITEYLGGGGMGLVYKARDLKLGRPVALKFLPPHLSTSPEAKERFKREAKAASALDHPNIATAYEIGETRKGHHFIAMAYYEGETLKEKIARGPLPMDEAIDHAAQIAEALAKAHEAGIVHRDVKPANVMVTDDGYMKLLDFGLATLGDAHLTRSGHVMGTAAYMSPEQALGETVDHRADLWSLGVLLYEMLTGERPFRGTHSQAVIYSILNKDPKPLGELRPNVPEQLIGIVEALMAKRPGDRLASAGQVIGWLRNAQEIAPTSDLPVYQRSTFEQSPYSSLEWKGIVAVLTGLILAGAIFVYVDPLATGEAYGLQEPESPDNPSVEITPLENWTPRLGNQSIAVLPFRCLGADDSSDYLSQGMTDELLIWLSQIDGLSVISRTSVMQYQNTTQPLPEIARELGVAYVLDGSVQRYGDEVRLQAQLVDARNDRHVWAQSFTRPFEDVLELQVELAREIAGQLHVTLVPETEARMAETAAIDSTAYMLYLQGRALRFQETGESLVEAARLLQQSIAIDSTYAPAWAVLSTVSYLTTAYGRELPGGLDGDSLARVAAGRALELDTTRAEVQIAAGNVLEILDGNFREAGRYFQRAVELNPGLVNANREYALYFMRMAQFDVADYYLREAERLDPASPAIMLDLGWNDLLWGRHERAKERLRRALIFQPDYPTAHAYLGLAYLGQDSLQVGLREMRRAVDEDPNPWTLAHLGWAYAQAGWQDSTQLVIERLEHEYGPNYLVDAKAALHIALGDTDRALDLLEEGGVCGCRMTVYPFFNALRGEPRFQRLLEEAGLDEASVQQTMEDLGEPTVLGSQVGLWKLGRSSQSSNARAQNHESISERICNRRSHEASRAARFSADPSGSAPRRMKA